MPRDYKPTGEATEIEKMRDRARRTYKKNTKKRTIISDAEKPVISDQVALLKLFGYTRSQISEIVGVSKGQVKELLSEPEVQKQIVVFRKALTDSAFLMGQTYLIEAIQAVVMVMRTSQDDAHILAAARELFDRFGIPKMTRSEQVQDRNVNTKNEETHIFGVDGDWVEIFSRATPEIQAQVADLEEGFQKLLKQAAESQNGASVGADADAMEE